MNVNLNTNADVVSMVKAYGYQGADPNKDAASPVRPGRRDEVIISPQGQQAAVQNTDVYYKLETAVMTGDFKELIEDCLKKNNKIPDENIRWDKMVDPDGEIYSTTYVETLIGQYQEALENIEAYYAEAHQENLSYDNPYNHILQKYMISGSPYFKSEMSRAEREMAFEQERALLWGGSLTMHDTYALAASGGLVDSEDASRIAHQAARDKVDELIRERKEALEV